nr:hypothetical protein Iba_chr09fCG3980 [Ipomoea batatas]
MPARAGLLSVQEHDLPERIVCPPPLVLGPTSSKPIRNAGERRAVDRFPPLAETRLVIHDGDAGGHPNSIQAAHSDPFLASLLCFPESFTIRFRISDPNTKNNDSDGGDLRDELIYNGDCPDWGTGGNLIRQDQQIADNTVCYSYSLILVHSIVDRFREYLQIGTQQAVANMVVISSAEMVDRNFCSSPDLWVNC